MTAPIVYLPTSGDGASVWYTSVTSWPSAARWSAIGQRRQPVVLGDHDDPTADALAVRHGIGGRQHERQVGTWHVGAARRWRRWRRRRRRRRRRRPSSAVASRSELHVDADPPEPALLPADPVGVGGVHRQLGGDGQLAAERALPLPQLARGGPARPSARRTRCPAGPPPMTSTERGTAARGGRPSSSRPACGLTPQANGRPSTTRRSMHSWRPMHGRISASAAVRRLDDQVRVGDRRPGEPDEVGVAVGQDPLGGVDARDPPDVDDGKVGGRPGLPGHRRPFALVVEARLDVADPAPVVADVEAEVVDRAVGGERGEHGPAVLDRLAAVDHLVEAQAQPDRDRPLDVVAHRLDDLPQESAAVLEAAAVAVGSVVRQRRQEPLQHVVVVGVQLEGVGVAFGGQRGRFAVLADQPGCTSSTSRAWGIRWSAYPDSVFDGADGMPPCWTNCTLPKPPAAWSRAMKRPSRSTKLGSRNSPGPLDPTPVGSNPGMSGLRTKVGPPPTHRTPPAIRRDPVACSVARTAPQTRAVSRRRRSATTRRAGGRAPSSRPRSGESDSGYLEAAALALTSRRDSCPTGSADRTRRQVCANRVAGWNSITGTREGGST